MAIIRWVTPQATRNPKVTRWLIVAHVQRDKPHPDLPARSEELFLHTINGWQASLADQLCGSEPAYIEWRDTKFGPELTHIARGEAA